MSALEIILLLVVLILGGLYLFELYKQRQMSRQLNQAQSERLDATQKLEALSTAFSTRKMVEGNLGEKLRDLSTYIQDVQDTYATELTANTALVSGFKAELNAPKVIPPPQLSEDNQADINATLSETAVSKTKSEPEPKPVALQATEKTKLSTEKVTEKSAEKSAEKSGAPASISMEVQAPTDTHVDRKVKP